MHIQTIENGKRELASIQNDLNQFVENVIPKLEQDVQQAGAPPIEQ
jgi:hypothetical protein